MRARARHFNNRLARRDRRPRAAWRRLGIGWQARDRTGGSQVEGFTGVAVGSLRCARMAIVISVLENRKRTPVSVEFYWRQNHGHSLVKIA